MSDTSQPQDSSSPCIVLITTSSNEEATAIASQLIKERLAACINIFPVQSMYRWEGNVCDDKEWQLVIKTDCTKFALLQERAVALHSYDVPEIISVQIAQGYPAYLQWMSLETQPQSE